MVDAKDYGNDDDRVDGYGSFSSFLQVVMVCCSSTYCLEDKETGVSLHTWTVQAHIKNTLPQCHQGVTSWRATDYNHSQTVKPLKNQCVDVWKCTGFELVTAILLEERRVCLYDSLCQGYKDGVLHYSSVSFHNK